MSDVPEHKIELYKKIRAMGSEELKSYERAAISSSRFINILGVGSLLGPLIYPSFVMAIFAGLTVFVLSHVSIGMRQTLDVIREQIAKTEKT